MALFAVDDEPDSFVDVEYVYDDNKNESRKNSNILFDFHVVYTRAPRVNSDGEEEDFDYDELETQIVCQTHDFEREWFYFDSYEEIQDCRDIVCYILERIDVPCYRDIVKILTKTLLDLKKRETTCALPKVEKVKVAIDIIVRRFPGEEEEDDEEEDDVDVKLAVAPASDEAVEANLKTVVIENDEGYCVICMDEIRVDSDVAASRMPCLHVFHRSCVEEWLRNSGICPVCRVVFPSEP